MILHAITVAGCGPFRSPRRLAGLRPGLNVLAGPNEAGKSTFFAALGHAFFTPYRSQSEAIRQLTPWGSELSPEITVEFEHHQVRYRLAKRLGSGAYCRLARQVNGAFEDEADSEQADTQVRELLLGMRPARGEARPEHWGLAQILWLPQGAVSALAPPAADERTRGRLHQLLGGIATPPGEDALLARLNEVYAETWTPSGQPQPSKNSALAQADAELGVAKAALAETQQRRREVEQTGEAIAGLQEKRRVLAAEREGLAQRLQQVRAEAEQCRALRQELRAEDERLSLLAEQFKVVDRDRQLTREKQEQSNGWRQQLHDEEGKLARARQDAAGAQQEAEVLAARRTTQRRQVDAAKQELLTLSHRRVVVGLAAERRQLRQRLEAAQASERQAAAVREELSSVPKVSPAHRKEIAALDEHRRELAIETRATGVAVTLELTADRAVHFAGSEGTGDLLVKPGEPATLHTVDELHLDLADVGHLRIRSGAREALKLREETEQVTTQLRALLDRYGLAAAADLTAVVSRREELEARQKDALKQLKQALGDFPDVAGLQTRIATVDGQLRSRCADLGLDEAAAATLPEPEPSEEQKQQQLVALGQADLRRAEEALTQQEEQCRVVRASIQEGERLLAALQAKLEAAEKTREAVLQRYEGVAGLETAYEDARRERDAQQSKVAALRQALPLSAEADPAATLARQEEALTRLERDLTSLTEEVHRLEGRLQSGGEQGWYSVESEQAERVALLQDRVTALRLRGQAARLLRTLALERRRQVAQQLLEPLARETTAYWQAVTGDRSRTVVFGDDLRIAAVRIGDQEVSVELLSTGAREQLFILARLALARSLARDEPQLLVMDDSLVNTDLVRLDRFLQLLETAADALQLVLLTCHEGRYRGLRGVNELRIEKVER